MDGILIESAGIVATFLAVVPVFSAIICSASV
jgi:hypothetical protein